MGAGAPIGNKNAEEWNFERSKKLFEDAVRLSDEKEEITKIEGGVKTTTLAYKFDFIGEIARELKVYHHLFNNLIDRFPELQPLKNQLDTNVQSNCYFNTKKGNIREATGIVNLKSNWKWTDRIDGTTDGKAIIQGLNINFLEEATKTEDTDYIELQ